MVLTATYSFYIGPPHDRRIIQAGSQFEPGATRYASADENAESYIRQRAARRATPNEVSDYRRGIS